MYQLALPFSTARRVRGHALHPLPRSWMWMWPTGKVENTGKWKTQATCSTSLHVLLPPLLWYSSFLRCNFDYCQCHDMGSQKKYAEDWVHLRQNSQQGADYGRSGQLNLPLVLMYSLSCMNLLESPLTSDVFFIMFNISANRLAKNLLHLISKFPNCLIL